MGILAARESQAKSKRLKGCLRHQFGGGEHVLPSYLGLDAAPVPAHLHVSDGLHYAVDRAVFNFDLESNTMLGITYPTPKWSYYQERKAHERRLD